jgi:hypothetical protein
LGTFGSDLEKKILAGVERLLANFKAEFVEFKEEIRAEVRSRKSSSAGSQVDDSEDDEGNAKAEEEIFVAVSPGEESKRGTKRSSRRESGLHQAFGEVLPSMAVSRIIQKEDFKGILKKLDIRAYVDHLTAINDFKDVNGNGVSVNLLSTLSRNVKDVLIYHVRQEYPTKEVDRRWLSRLTEDQVDQLCRRVMRPATKADFLDVLAKKVTYWTPDGFKPGIFNFQQQFTSYQNYAEEFRKMYVLMAFEQDYDFLSDKSKRLFDADKVPEVDAKEEGLITYFRKGLPKHWADHFFKLLPKPKAPAQMKGVAKWSNFLEFLNKMNALCHQESRIYNEQVRRFLNLYGNSDQPSGGRFKSISEYAQHEDPLDGNPTIMSLTEYSDSVKEEVATVLHSLGVPTMGTQKVDQQKTGKQVRLACWSMVMNNECPNGRDCRFSHDKADLQAKAREIAKQISKSPHFSGLVELVGSDDDT